MTQYFNDCSSLDDWSELGLSAGDQFSVSSGAIVNTSTSAERLVYDPVESDSERQDVEILCKLKLDDVSTTHNMFGGRSSGTSTRAGYLVSIRPTEIRTFKVVSGTATQIATASSTHSDNTWYWVRLRINGTSPASIQARSWADGASEPGTWTLDSTDSDISGDGAVWLYSPGTTGANYSFDAVGVGTNGDTAPASAPSTATSLPFRRAAARQQHLMVR